MGSLKKICLILMVIMVVSKPSKCISNRGKIASSLEKSHNHCSINSNCPTWFICNAQNRCQCGDGHNNAVVCDKFSSAVLDCHCVTYDEAKGETFLGSCYYNCNNNYGNKTKVDKVYTMLPKKALKLLNRSVCSEFNRKGLLCGDCEDGHSPLVLTYNLSCVECPDGHKNWWKFILVAFVPLTFFYLFIVLFNINVTSSHLHGVVLFSQAMSIPAIARLFMSAVRYANSQSQVSAKVFLVFYSFWNLDILRSVLPDICLNITTLQALALDYLLALYPFLLILISYFFIELYDRKVVCIVIMWKPFHKLLTFFRKSWDIRTSVIDSFATFFLLSNFKILSVSSDLLLPTQIYQLGSNRSTLGLYYSPNVVYFGKEHLPYAIVALIFLKVFVIVPIIILILYPFRFFQKFLSLFPFNWHFLHAFVDSFQGCYKDGTEPKTFDCRWFSSLVLLIRPIFFIIFSLTLSMMYFVYTIIILVIFLILLINIQPFKKATASYPSTDIIFFILISVCYEIAIGRNIADTEEMIFKQLLLYCTFLLAFVSIAYTIIIILFWFISRVKSIKSLFNF